MAAAVAESPRLYYSAALGDEARVRKRGRLNSERSAPNFTCVVGFQDRQVRGRDADPIGQFGARQAPRKRRYTASFVAASPIIDVRPARERARRTRLRRRS
jgi:hypothetical protein